MNPLKFLAMALFFSFSLFGQVKIEEILNGLRYEIHIDEFVKTKVQIGGKVFTKTTLKGISPFEGVIQEEGRPEVPVMRIYVDGEGDITVSSGPRLDRGKPRGDLLMTGKSIPKRRGEKRALAIPREASVDENLRFRKNFEIVRVGVRRGVLRRMVELFPIQWDPASGAETQVKHFVVEVPKPIPKIASDRAFGIVLPEVFKDNPAFERWVEFKRGRGEKTLVYFSQTKDPQVVRSVIQDWYRKWPGLETVVLVGDVEYIPSFQSTVLSGFTDHFYSSLDGSYSEDLMSPDVMVGRLPVHNEIQLSELLDRFILYSTLSSSEAIWLKKNSLIATNDPEFWKPTEESLLSLIRSYFEPSGYVGSFPKQLQGGGDQLFAVTHKATGLDLKSAFSEGRSFILYSGHGEHHGWEDPALKASEVETLELRGSMPFVFGFSCQTGKFTEHSMAEAWVERASGAVSSVGSFADTYWDEDFLLQAVAMEGLLQRRMSVGKSMEWGLEEVWRYYGGRNFSNYYWETYNVFADPSQVLRSY